MTTQEDNMIDVISSDIGKIQDVILVDPVKITHEENNCLRLDVSVDIILGSNVKEIAYRL